MIGLIFSQSHNGYIGKDGKLLFHIPEDMKRFSNLTNNTTVIMGRKTWESLPDKFRPLPNRFNFVLSRDRDFSIDEDGTFVFRSLKDALRASADRATNPKVWIIGGESLYEEGLKFANVIEQTLIFKAMDGDAKAPEIDERTWRRYEATAIREHNDYLYQFNTYRRI